ncbi:MAG: hypothetical protein CMJ46_06870 [Planctomyces sp.]|nr:hypothetical protein [Planctomyces sp.]
MEQGPSLSRSWGLYKFLENAKKLLLDYTSISMFDPKEKARPAFAGRASAVRNLLLNPLVIP